MIFAFHTKKFSSVNVYVQLCTNKLRFLVFLDLVEVNKHFMHHVADNADQKSRTLIGCNTFYGLGIICSVTPVVCSSFAIPRLENMSTELRQLDLLK